MSSTFVIDDGEITVTGPPAGPLSGPVSVQWSYTPDAGNPAVGEGMTYAGAIEYADVLNGVATDLDTTRLPDGNHTLTLQVGGRNQFALAYMRFPVTTANGTTRRGCAASDLYLAPGESADLACACVKCDGTAHAAPTVTDDPTLPDCYYNPITGTPDPGCTPSVAGGVLSFAAATGPDVAAYEVATDAGDAIRHRVITRASGDCRPHLGRSGQVRTTYDADDSFFPVAVFNFNPRAAVSYGAAARQELLDAGVLPALGFLPEIPIDCASAAEWWDSAAAWRASAEDLAANWGGKVYAEDDTTWGASGDLASRLGVAVQSAWWYDAIAQWVDWWRSLPCGLPVFVVARDETEISFGDDPTDTGHPNIAAIGADGAARYVDAIRAASGPPVCFYPYGITCLSVPRGGMKWHTPTYADFTHFSGDSIDSQSPIGARMVRSHAMYADVARHLDPTRPNVAPVAAGQWSDWVTKKDGVNRIGHRARVSPRQMVAFNLLPVLLGSVGVRGYSSEDAGARGPGGSVTGTLATAPTYPSYVLAQYYSRFERVTDYYPDGREAGHAFLRFAGLVKDLTPLLLGLQVTATPWGPGWRVGRWESSRGTLVIAVNVSGLTETVPATLDVSGFTAAEWVDGDSRASLTVGDVPGLSVPADRVVVLTA